MVNGARSVELHYRRDGERWVLVKAIADEVIETLLGNELLRMVPVPASSSPHRVHVRMILDALAKENLDGGSIFEEVTRSFYRAEIEVKTKSARF